MTDQRLHMSHVPLRTVRDVAQPDTFTGEGGIGKPRGLWYGVGDAWLRWCRSERMTKWIGRYTYAIEVDRTRLLVLSSDIALRAFSERFGIAPPWGHDLTSRLCVDWPRVAQEWDGIEITPYVWSCRLDPATSWYYGWDCASGCIWRSRAVMGFRRVPRPRGR